MVTIVMPCYNEEEIIEAGVREWHGEVIAKLKGADLLVVDDCSTDQSGRILERLSTELPGVRWVRPERNGGHGRALRFGFQFILNDYVFQTDSDRQHVPAEFWKLWEVRDDYDFVFGVRKARADGTLRRLITRAMRIANLFIWGIWVSDANCPFKLMKRKALMVVLEKIPSDVFIPMVMVSLLSRKMGFRTTEVAVSHLPRKGGSQSLKGIVRWIWVSSVCLWQLLGLRLRVRRL